MAKRARLPIPKADPSPRCPRGHVVKRLGAHCGKCSGRVKDWRRRTHAERRGAYS